MAKRKRRLTKAEVNTLSIIMDSAPLDKKPGIRALARHFGVTRPSIIKSLGGWEGIQRNRLDKDIVRRVIDRNVSSPVKIEPFQVDVADQMR